MRETLFHFHCAPVYQKKRHEWGLDVSVKFSRSLNLLFSFCRLQFLFKTTYKSSARAFWPLAAHNTSRTERQQLQLVLVSWRSLKQDGGVSSCSFVGLRQLIVSTRRQTDADSWRSKVQIIDLLPVSHLHRFVLIQGWAKVFIWIPPCLSVSMHHGLWAASNSAVFFTEKTQFYQKQIQREVKNLQQLLLLPEVLQFSLKKIHKSSKTPRGLDDLTVKHEEHVCFKVCLVLGYITLITSTLILYICIMNNVQVRAALNYIT